MSTATASIPAQPSSPKSSKKGRIAARSRPRLDPEHALRLRIDDHRGIAMALLNRELVYHQEAHPCQALSRDRAEPVVQRAQVDLLHRVPVDVKPPRDMPDRQHHSQTGDLLSQARRHALVPVKPGHRLDRRPTARTRQASARKDDPGVPVEHWEIPHAPLGHIMDFDHQFATPAAALRIPGYGAQS